MILFFESEVYNNPPPNQDDEMNSDEIPEDNFEEQMIPIKRYYLTTSLLKLQNNLSIINYENEILNTLITFIENISYEHLMIITPKLLEFISQDLTRLKNEKTE